MRGPALQNQAPTSTTHILIEWWTLQPTTLPPCLLPHTSKKSNPTADLYKIHSLIRFLDEKLKVDTRVFL